MKATLPGRADRDTDAVIPDLHARHDRLHQEMVDQMERTAAVENHWLVYVVLGWQFLAACVASHFLVEGEASSDFSHVPLAALWLVQTIVALVTVRLITGQPQVEDSPLQPYVRNLGAIFLLLSGNVGVLVVMTGQPVTTFLPLLATLSSFLFLILRFLFSRRFGLVALAMFLTGSLMARFPRYGFLLYGAAWFLVLQAMGLAFWQKRNHWLAHLCDQESFVGDEHG